MKRMIIPVGVGVVVIAGLAVLYSHSIYKQTLKTTEELIKKEMLIMAEQAAEDITELFSDYIVELKWLSELPQIRKIKAKETAEFCDTERKDKPYFHTLFRIDKNGILTFINPPDALPGVMGKDFSFRSYFKEAKQTGKPAISELVESGYYEDVKDRFKAIILSAPVFMPDSGFDGVIGTTMRLKVIAERFINPLKVGKNGYAWMLDNNGTTIAHPEMERIGKTMKEKEREDPPELISLIKGRLIKGETGFGEYTYRGVKEIVAYAPIRAGRHILPVAVSLPYDDVKALVYPMYIRLVMLMFFVAAVVIAGGMIFVMKTMEVKKLKEKIVALAIKIDEEKRARDIASITETDYFRQLVEKVEDIKSDKI